MEIRGSGEAENRKKENLELRVEGPESSRQRAEWKVPNRQPTI
jgi:hypothetical protein